VLVVSDERPFRVGGEGGLAGARQPEEQRHIARPAEIGEQCIESTPRLGSR